MDDVLLSGGDARTPNRCVLWLVFQVLQLSCSDCTNCDLMVWTLLLSIQRVKMTHWRYSLRLTMVSFLHCHSALKDSHYECSLYKSTHWRWVISGNNNWMHQRSNAEVYRRLVQIWCRQHLWLPLFWNPERGCFLVITMCQQSTKNKWLRNISSTWSASSVTYCNLKGKLGITADEIVWFKYIGIVYSSSTKYILFIGSNLWKALTVCRKHL